MTQQLDVARLGSLLDGGGVQLFEVLPEEEYRWAHLPAARHLPLSGIDEARVAELEPGQPVVVYCNDFL